LKKRILRKVLLGIVSLMPLCAITFAVKGKIVNWGDEEKGLLRGNSSIAYSAG